MDFCWLHHPLLRPPGIQMVASAESYEDWRYHGELPGSSRCENRVCTGHEERARVPEVRGVCCFDKRTERL